MLTRNEYYFEKMAQAILDGQQIANKQQDENLVDNRETLTGLFDNTSGASKAETSLVNRLFPKRGPTDTSNPLIKEAFYSMARETGLFKTASPTWIGIAQRAFEDELQKLAEFLGAGKVRGAYMRMAKGTIQKATKFTPKPEAFSGVLR